MSYEPWDTKDPWWLLPLIITFVIGGLVWWGVSASVEYVEEEGYEVTK